MRQSFPVDVDGERVVVRINGEIHVLTYKEANRLSRRLEKAALEVAKNIRENEENNE